MLAPLELVSDGLLSVTQAAELVSLGRTTIYAAMDRGELPYAKLGRARRIPRRAVLEWAARNLVGAGNESR